MLPRSQRLNLKKDFKWVAAGKKIDSQYAKLFIRKGDNSSPRIGIATSSSQFKKATERNRARRLMSAALEPLYAKLPKSINIIALPKQSILDVKSGNVLLDVEENLKREKIIH